MTENAATPNFPTPISRRRRGRGRWISAASVVALSLAIGLFGFFCVIALTHAALWGAYGANGGPRFLALLPKLYVAGVLYTIAAVPIATRIVAIDPKRQSLPKFSAAIILRYATLALLLTVVPAVCVSLVDAERNLGVAVATGFFATPILLYSVDVARRNADQRNADQRNADQRQGVWRLPTVGGFFLSVVAFFGAFAAIGWSFWIVSTIGLHVHVDDELTIACAALAFVVGAGYGVWSGGPFLRSRRRETAIGLE
jgi:hypothetical protein